jgi:AcrR family transcriptional regulator
MPHTRHRGRPRLEETGHRIIAAALELLREKGPTAVNIDAVAGRSGVARTTIYRRYRSREDLVEAAINELVDRPLPPQELSVSEKLRWVLEQVHDFLEEGLGRGGIAGVLADTDPAFTDALRKRIAEQLSSLMKIMATDIEAGQVSERVDPDILVGLLFGAYLGEVLRHDSPRTDWLDRTVDLMTEAITTH